MTSLYQEVHVHQCDRICGLQKLAEEIEKQYVSINSNGSSAGVAKLSFPHIKEVAPDDHMREELEQRLRVETENIIQEFRILRHKLFDSLEDQKIAADKLVEYLEEEVGELLQQEVIDSEPKTFKDVKTFIKRNSSFYDYQLVKYMIKLTGTDKDKNQLKKYEKTFFHYAERRVCECPSKFSSSDDTSSELHVKLDSKYDECKLKELKNFQYQLQSILGISVYVCCLKSTDKGCTLLTFIIPYHIHKAIFPLSAEQETSLLELGVLWLTCRDYHYSRPENQVLQL